MDITLFKPSTITNTLSTIVSPITSTIKSISFANYLYYTSIFLIAKSSYNVIQRGHIQRTKQSNIKALLLQETKTYSFDQMTPESYSILYYLYLKTYHQVFNSELLSFKSYRRKLLKANRIYHYIKYCQMFHKQMKVYELDILASMSECFNIKYDIVKTIFSKGDVNYKEIKGKFYAELKLDNDGMNRSDWDIKKTEEIIKYLHSQYLIYYAKIKEMNMNIKEEKVQLISECFAFDKVYFEYGIEEEVIEKCLYENNLDIVEY